MRLVSWKYGNAIAVCAMAIVFGQIGGAQELHEAQPTPAPATPAPAPAPAPPTAQPTPKPVEMTSPRRMLPVPAVANIRVDITITDQAGSEPPLKKTLTVIAADGGSGAVRSKATIAMPVFPPGPDPKNYTFENLPLNVDISPHITENENRIRMRLIVNYETFSSKASGMPAVRSVVTVDQSVMLENGKPLVVSQSADATTDRRVTVELKATIMK
jgi:pyruvate/2-oxoglutarate dehydrogenase complex dihydrolipoamide acyltransferase (E2) component